MIIWEKNIVVIGLTYKPNVADLRNSLSINIFKNLKKKYLNTKNYDPIIKPNIAKKLKIGLDPTIVKRSDIFIFLVKHKKVRNIYEYAKKNKKIIIDPLSEL